MSEDEFWYSTPKYFYYRQRANEKEMQRQWEIARYNAWHIVCSSPYVKKGLTQRKMGLFPWERPKSRRIEYDAEELKRFSESADKLILGDAVNKRS